MIGTCPWAECPSRICRTSEDLPSPGTDIKNADGVDSRFCSSQLRQSKPRSLPSSRFRPIGGPIIGDGEPTELGFHPAA